MARWVRFVVHQRFSNFKHDAGLFTAVGDLLDNGAPSIEERERLEEITEWFRLKLPVPRTNQGDERAIYWYEPSAREHITKMWELAHILESHGYAPEMITANFVGRIVYWDEFQVGAIPHVDRHR